MEYLANIFWSVLPIVITIITPSVFILATWLSKKIGSKMTLEQQAAINEIIGSIVEQGIGYAEQVAKNKKKELEDVTGNDKLLIATNYILEEINRSGLKELAIHEVQRRIESYLGIISYEDQRILSLGEGENDGDDEQNFIP